MTLGNVLITQEIHDLGIERHGSMRAVQKFFLFFRSLYFSFQNSYLVNLALKIAKDFGFPQV